MAGDTELARLIEAHREAERAFADIAPIEGDMAPDDPMYPEMKARCEAASEAEATALRAICGYRHRTPAEAGTKAEYLAAYSRQHDGLEEESVAALLASYAPERAAA
jgi:hypothetical protein